MLEKGQLVPSSVMLRKDFLALTSFDCWLMAARTYFQLSSSPFMDIQSIRSQEFSTLLFVLSRMMEKWVRRSSLGWDNAGVMPAFPVTCELLEEGRDIGPELLEWGRPASITTAFVQKQKEALLKVRQGGNGGSRLFLEGRGQNPTVSQRGAPLHTGWKPAPPVVFGASHAGLCVGSSFAFCYFLPPKSDQSSAKVILCLGPQNASRFLKGPRRNELPFLL